MNAVVNVLTAILNIRIRFKYVLLAFIIFVGGAIGITYKHMLDLVGGKDDFDEAKRYIEIKDVVEEQYIDEVSRQTLGDYAAAAMVSGLADKWSYYMSADEYKTYQLNSANEYSGIGMSIMKQDDGSFQVVSVNADSPAGLAGLGAGDVITAVDGEDITSMSLDEARKLIRSKMNGKFTLGLGRKNSIEVDCSSAYQSAVNYRLEKTEAGYIQILNFEAGSGDDAIAAVEDLLNQGAVALCIDLRGNPGGLDYQNTTTKGVISALDRKLSTSSLTKYIQTDAAINPGNSGGPLVNYYGQVVGITTSKIVSETYEGMGFAIPSQTVKSIVDTLVKNGYVEGRVKIGISGIAVTSDQASNYNIPQGIYVQSIVSGGPCDGTSLEEGDIITEVDGETITSFADVYAILETHKPGDKIKVKYYSSSSGDGEVEITLQEDK